MAIYKTPLPRKGKILSYFVVSDLHSLEVDPLALSIFFQHLKLAPVEARRVIIVGDLLNFDLFRSKDKFYKRQIKSKHGVDDYFLPEYQKEMNWGNWFFDELGALSPEIIYIEGNHEKRIEYFKENCPMSQRHLFNYQRDLKLDERKIKFIPYPSFLDIGRVSFTHGHLHCKRYLEAHTREIGYRDIIMGHMHRDESERFKSRNITVRAQSLPCLCSLEPDYLGGKPHLWTQGYARIFFRDDGGYNLRVESIENHQLTLEDGTTLNGSEESYPKKF